MMDQQSTRRFCGQCGTAISTTFCTQCGAAV
jgi:ribosomal protein S27AE